MNRNVHQFPCWWSAASVHWDEKMILENKHFKTFVNYNTAN